MMKTATVIPLNSDPAELRRQIEQLRRERDSVLRKFDGLRHQGMRRVTGERDMAIFERDQALLKLAARREIVVQLAGTLNRMADIVGIDQPHALLDALKMTPEAFNEFALDIAEIMSEAAEVEPEPGK